MSGSRSTGLVVAAHQAAADAGTLLLEAGGSAMDAAVATAFALAVVEPAQCGLGGYGGFLTYAPAGGDPIQVAFNTCVPERLAGSLAGTVGGDPTLPDGGGAVAPPAVVAGLLAAHRCAGRKSLEELLAPAIELARDGFAIGPDLARAFEDHWKRTGGGSPEFARVFFPSGRPPAVGSRLVQTDLAATLESLSEDSFRRGPVIDAICDVVRADGGFLEPADLLDCKAEVGPAVRQRFETARVFGPVGPVSGAGILFSALAALDPDSLGKNRDDAYLAEVARVLRQSWTERARFALGDLEATHTTHLSTAARDGSLAALTFTHGRRKFGSGLVAPGTGVVLNAGVGLYAHSPLGPRAVTNMTPVIVEGQDGSRHALGAVGGPRIPAVVLTAIIDVVHYGVSLAEALAAPHVAVRATDGALEAEAGMVERLPDGTEWSALRPGEAFGPACGITAAVDGTLTPAPDPRFEIGVARAA